MRGSRVERGAEPVEQFARTGNRSRIEQRQQEFRIVRFELGKLAKLTHLMADDDAEIPQRMQKAA